MLRADADLVGLQLPGGRQLKTSAFADDTGAFTALTARSVQALRNQVGIFDEFAGARMNWHKSVALVPDMNAAPLFEGMRVQPATNDATYLGIELPHALTDGTQIEQLMRKAAARLALCGKTSDAGVFGRALLANSVASATLCQDRITRDAKREMEEIWDVSMEEPQRGLIGKKRARLRKKMRAASDAETGQETSALEAEAANRPKAVMDKPLLPTPLGEVESEPGTAGPALGETVPKPGTAWANPLVLSSSASLSLSPTLPPPGPRVESNAVAQIQVDDMELMEYQRLEEEQENPGPIQREEEQRAFDDIHVRRMLLLDGKFDELREQGRLRVVPLVLRLTEIKLQILLCRGQATDRPPKIPFIRFAGHPSMQKPIVTAERWLGGAYEVLPMKGVSAIRLRLKPESLGAYCFMLRVEPRPQANHEEDPHFSWTDLEPLILELPDPEENSTVQDDTTAILALLNKILPENKRFTHRTFITDPEMWLRGPRHRGRQAGRIPAILNHGCASTHRLHRKTTKN
ncbi:hypothetical protein CBR_g24016 [Chara braunii]|uniref:Reverse transcriptase domain-containing protein n=1 Tax=Chara braunii TaxID=69332 RepID=A0A388L5G9_CHABU|nr:hypothetical protein CBR_g24016 [Chara braunii]|eukprot:GBG77569.1 hypothetical protein CBR_g24016 [Chara braunii]